MTWRQLFAMSLGAWDRTAYELSVMMDVNRDKEKRRKPFRPTEFHPIECADSPGLPVMSGEDLYRMAGGK